MDITSVIFDKKRGWFLSIVLSILSIGAIYATIIVIQGASELTNSTHIILVGIMLLALLINLSLVLGLWLWKKWAYVIAINLYCIMPVLALVFGYLFTYKPGRNQPQSSDYLFL